MHCQRWSDRLFHAPASILLALAFTVSPLALIASPAQAEPSRPDRAPRLKPTLTCTLSRVVTLEQTGLWETSLPQDGPPIKRGADQHDAAADIHRRVLSGA